MFSKNTNIIRGHSEREVERKVKEFIYVREESRDEEWKAHPEGVQYQPARLFGHKPWFCVVSRVKSDV
ncbi:coil containing protein [Vibrio phage 409E50-1]|nr:coil containing protein [Vibrio phage 521E56-1]CAH9012170.1 coil containing protein [Vibrio phage 384E50-1]CAH9012197.1 coil containing protein [Vibrio phage 402E50-1]CAH9012201.1 coil containing protein [Vibrio phage 409E50-1]CAH9013378.1 coil containing protein [Vibrio phage 405E50-1]CAH9013432.1 coil containing protein [Vibrio phage 413E50-1]